MTDFYGRVRPYLVLPDLRWIRKGGWTRNTTLKEWAAIVGNLLTTGKTNYRISRMYLEFANVASPGNTATPPSFDREPGSGVAYYNGLALSSNKDYLRVPIISAQLLSTGPDYPYGNEQVYFAQSSGTVGVHGKPFSSVNNSVVYGGALVAAVNDNDAAQDLVMSRFYLAPADQQPKLPSGQVGLEWPFTLK